MFEQVFEGFIIIGKFWNFYRFCLEASSTNKLWIFFSKNYYGIYKQESAKTVPYAPRSYMHINSKIYSVIFIRSQINQRLLYIVKWAKTKKIFKQKILAQYLSTALCSVSSISKIEVYTHRKKIINPPSLSGKTVKNFKQKILAQYLSTALCSVS